MGRGKTGLAVVLLMAAQPGAWAQQSQSDVVWPTYDLVEFPSDTKLGCDALAAEITHVGADIRMLNKAKLRVEDILHSAFDMERYGGSRGPGSSRIPIGAVDGKETYATARGQIVVSLKVAEARQDHLKSLEPACRPGPKPVAAP